MESTKRNRKKPVPTYSKSDFDKLFILQSKLGHGSFAKVIGALDIESKKRCAVKVLFLFLLPQFRLPQKIINK